MAEDYLAWTKAQGKAYEKESAEILWHTCYALAQEGHELYERLFRPSEDEINARRIRAWLERLRDGSAVESLELVLEGDPGVAWNVVYDLPPQREAFLGGCSEPGQWQPFWGVRYNLAAGKRVDPLRRVPAPSEPSVRMVVDPIVLGRLPDEQKKRLLNFARTHGDLSLIQTREELVNELSAGRPDLLYWLSHATPHALELDGELVRPLELFELMEKSDDNSEKFPGLVFLNACRTAEAEGVGSSFLSVLYEAKCSGVIATEQQTVDTVANTLGLDFLEAFLDLGEPVGSLMQRLRTARVPMGLVYATYCPPHLSAPRPAPRSSDSCGSHSETELPGSVMSRLELPSGVHLPERPYRSLSSYDRDDRALFAGRDGDVLRFAHILDESATRVLVLHGESGCGKSSFLRAGVIPFLEDECVGYRFVHDRLARGGGSPLFVRATNDLAGQLAVALLQFCSEPLRQPSPEGEPLLIDLPQFIRDMPEVPSLRAGLLKDRKLLGRLLTEIGSRLSYTPVLVIDQAEEIFTLARAPEDRVNREKTLEMLRETVELARGFKIVVSLRTDYYGRFVDPLRRSTRASYGTREYLLYDLGMSQLTEAIVRPTRFKKYGFGFADGVAERLAGQIIDHCVNRQDSVLPLAQVICSELYGLVTGRAQKEIRVDDVAAIGGVDGGLRRHVEDFLAQQLPDPVDRQAFRRLFTRLYLRQPDGTLTTALLPEGGDGVGDAAVKHWSGRMPWRQLLDLATRPGTRLLRINTLRAADAERHFVSLGHDALARVAADWDAERTHGTQLRVELMLRMRPLPTAIYHLLDPDTDPVLTVVMGNDASEARRICVRTYLEELSSQDVRTLVLEPHSETRINVRPPLLPARVREMTAERWTTWHLVVEDLDQGSKIERHEGIEVLCLPPSFGFYGVARPETGQLIDLTPYFAAWVTPCSEAVQNLIRRAASFTSRGLLKSYVQDPVAITEQVQALYLSLREAGITYIDSVVPLETPAGYVSQGPRLPRESLTLKSANCLDGTLLFASLLEGASLRPILVFVPGHAFVGWELNEEGDEYDFLETTLISSTAFAEACRVGRRLYEDNLKYYTQTVRVLRVAHLRARGIYALE
jgi:hypothetical protein